MTTTGTMMRIEKELLAKLKGKKKHKNESYADVVRRLLNKRK